MVKVVTVILFLCVNVNLSWAQNIKVGHLTYLTGEYGEFGSLFNNVTDFALSIINKDPPLGRPMEVIHQDIGTIGEARAARRLVERQAVDVLLNPAHDYMSYRDYILAHISKHQTPLLPSVHGGAIEAQYGGIAAEPLFRGSPMDTSQAAAALLHAKNSGKRSLVIVASEAAGSQLQKQAAINAAINLDLKINGTFNLQPNLPNYRPLVTRIAELTPDAVIMFTAPIEGGQFVKDVADFGFEWFVIGSSEWQEASFIQTATLRAIESQEDVLITAFSHNEGPAWDHYLEQLSGSMQASMIGDGSNSYAIQYYDLLIASALAIELAGDVHAGAWSEAMNEVTDSQGTIVHTYQDGINALRAGKDINYEGVTGSMEYNKTGVPAGLFGIFKWVTEQYLERVSFVDGDEVLALDQND